MSSENIGSHDKEMYWWNDSLDESDYVEVVVYYETNVDIESAALGMAKEQSCCATELETAPLQFDLKEHTVRVSDVRALGSSTHPILNVYTLKTNVYPDSPTARGIFARAEATLHFPVINFGNSLTSLWNFVPGEIYRLGFLNTVRLKKMRFPENYVTQFQGPRYGMDGIRQKLNIPRRPIFCRSCRPAVGLTTEQMVTINREVLLGGFDVVKDDELTFDNHKSPFRERVEAMQAMLKDVEDRTGEKKLYIANITADCDKVMRLAETASKAGVEGVLVSPVLQGVTITQKIANDFDFIMFAHNSCEDIWHRHPQYGMDNAVLYQLHRLSGADMIVLSADFSSAAISEESMRKQVKACTFRMDGIARTMPVIAGGKTASQLGLYQKHVGGSDFMMIVATAVDENEGGLRAGARAFREAWDELENP